MQFKWQCAWVQCKHKQEAATNGFGKMTLICLRCGKANNATIFRREGDDRAIAAGITPKVES